MLPSACPLYKNALVYRMKAITKINLLKQPFSGTTLFATQEWERFNYLAYLQVTSPTRRKIANCYSEVYLKFEIKRTAEEMLYTKFFVWMGIASVVQREIFKSFTFYCAHGKEIKITFHQCAYSWKATLLPSIANNTILYIVEAKNFWYSRNVFYRERGETFYNFTSLFSA